MPRVSAGVGGRFRIPGVYEKLLTETSRFRYGPLLDPRMALCDMSSERRAVWDWLTAEARWREQQRTRVRLAAGEPYLVPQSRFGGHTVPRTDSWPGWLMPYSGVTAVRVFADDTVEPADPESWRRRQ